MYMDIFNMTKKRNIVNTPHGIVNTAKSVSAIKELEVFCQELPHEIKPVIKWYTGNSSPASNRTALVTVDFGYTSPLQRLNPEQNRDLVQKIRKAVLEYTGVEMRVNVQSDTYLGLIYWANTSFS